MLSILLALAAAPGPAAQAPEFEVASVKRNNSGDGSTTRRMQPGGTTFINVTLRQLVIGAYGVQSFQVFDGPSWITSDRFDITAASEVFLINWTRKPTVGGIATRTDCGMMT